MPYTFKLIAGFMKSFIGMSRGITKYSRKYESIIRVLFWLLRFQLSFQFHTIHASKTPKRKNSFIQDNVLFSNESIS